MKALVIDAPHSISIKEISYPKPGPNEVTVKVLRAGICGTDIHIFEGNMELEYPVVPGHEFSGVIHELGEGVEHYRIGDRVSADPSVGCGKCRHCRAHRTNLCIQFGGLGTTLQGSMAEYVKVSADKLVAIPDSMSEEEAAFIEPMACVVQAMNRLKMEVASRVLLFGAGAMGLQLVQAMAQAGASELVVVDISQKKLDLALQLGATKGVLSGNLEKELSLEDEDGFDIVVDVTGIPSVIEKAFDFMGGSSKFLQFGVAAPDAVIRIHPYKVYHSEWTIVGSMALNGTFLSAFQWIKDGRIQLQPLVSQVMTMQEAVDYFRGKRDPDFLKLQIRFD
ncbi:zinc-dependent alcohol dehydrogenase family protein [Paenibacillus senegalensis]|uniref:zinc-dependent alcohol dehydrogenase family protein n=1 Tax=Paenibacillus senegalensis TaxID=1465766 RepID=UPI0002885C7D|nr:zinc-dependent alcohol dehydrogenase family protein [Paenibacillus senegalensis]